MKSFSGSCETDAYVFLISLFRTSTSISTSIDITPPRVDPSQNVSSLYHGDRRFGGAGRPRGGASEPRLQPHPHEHAGRDGEREHTARTELRSSRAWAGFGDPPADPEEHAAADVAARWARCGPADRFPGQQRVATAHQPGAGERNRDGRAHQQVDPRRVEREH